MNVSLLNCLIDAQRLIEPVVETDLDDYAQAVSDWQHAVEVSVAHLQRPLSESHQQAIRQLLVQNETMIENLIALKSSLHKDHKSLLKGNTAVHAYVGNL